MKWTPGVCTLDSFLIDPEKPKPTATTLTPVVCLDSGASPRRPRGRSYGRISRCVYDISASRVQSSFGTLTARRVTCTPLEHVTGDRYNELNAAGRVVRPGGVRQQSRLVIGIFGALELVLNLVHAVKPPALGAASSSSRLPMADHASHASSSFFLAALATRARLR